MARLATSLETLRNEVDAVAPNRSRVSDGWLGDPAHQGRPSRHNPNVLGVVTALDVTHDPAGDCDIHAIAEQIRRHPHPELDYMVSNGRICSRRSDWDWREYSGDNPHTAHVHFAVGVGPDSNPLPPYDSTAPWGVEGDMPITEAEMDAIAAKVADELERRLTPADPPSRISTRLIWASRKALKAEISSVDKGKPNTLFSAMRAKVDRLVSKVGA